MWIKCLAEGQNVPGIDGNRNRNPLIQSQGFNPIYHGTSTSLICKSVPYNNHQRQFSRQAGRRPRNCHTRWPCRTQCSEIVLVARMGLGCRGTCIM